MKALLAACFALVMGLSFLYGDFRSTCTNHTLIAEPRAPGR